MMLESSWPGSATRGISISLAGDKNLWGERCPVDFNLVASGPVVGVTRSEPPRTPQNLLWEGLAGGLKIRGPLSWRQRQTQH